MALTKDTVITVHIDENLTVTVMRRTRWFDDGDVVGSREIGKVYLQGEDISSEPAKIRNIAAAAWA